MSLYTRRVTNNLLNSRGVFLILKKFKSKSQLKEEYNPCNKALKYFDDFYKAVFAEKWPSVRLALLSKQKYFAVINNFGDAQKTEEYLKSQGAFNLKSFLEVQKNFVVDSCSENATQSEREAELKDIIHRQLLQEEEKESQLLHPEGIEFKAKVDYYSQLNEENEKTDEFSYKPEDARSSLEADLKMSQIDKSRLITPDSMTDATTLHDFIPATQLRGTEGYIAESDYYKYYKVKSISSFCFQEENKLDFPENLLVYTFDRGETLDFSEPIKCSNNVYNYLKIDGGDLLVALALNVQPEDAVLDMCSTTGSISYCVFQTFRPKLLVCTDDKKSETEMLFSQYFCDYESLRDRMLLVTSNSMDETEYGCLFDKVLVDVPCTFDKTALSDLNNNMFHNQNIKQRLQLPEIQCSLLLKGMKLVRPGGTVIYTTSTLSPVQNEGVVNEALKSIWEKDKIKFTIKKLSPALQHMSCFFNFGDYLNLKFGTLVVPFMPINFGPRYVCKLIRNKEQTEENAMV